MAKATNANMLTNSNKALINGIILLTKAFLIGTVCGKY